MNFSCQKSLFLVGVTDKDFKRSLRNFSNMNVSEYWLISAPGDRTCQETWDRLNQVRVVFSYRND